ncbi:MAG: GAF domain-containing protein [Caldilineales bacterium]|nr:GAF domain-containing protein [Caldilineales bacterium]
MTIRPGSSATEPIHPLLLLEKALLILAFVLGLWLAGTRTWGFQLTLLGVYLVLSAATLVALRQLSKPSLALYCASYLLDLGLLLYLIRGSGGLASPFWPLLALQAFLPALYLPWPYLTWIGAFGSGLLYILLLWSSTGSLAFLVNPMFLGRYLVLFITAILAAVTAESVQQARTREQALQQTLATREADIDAQAQRLQRTAADLGDRVLQLRSLQEVARTLAATPDLPETLQVLVDRLAVMAGAQYAAIALIDGDETRLRGVAASGPDAAAIRDFAVDLAKDMQAASLLAAANVISSRDTDFLGFEQLQSLWRMDQFLCLPLVLRGRPLGALYLADSSRDFDTERQRQLLGSFSYFAAAAVENAQLFQAVADKSRELEAILAGIGDGVIVVDADLNLVLMNPVAASIFALDAAPPTGLPVQMFVGNEGFLDLLARVKQEPYQALSLEIEAGQPGGGSQPTYQGLAAPLVVNGSLQGIATVLRDITGQKELERMKSNFLSVVSHELKTPLHSIKGFVDIILMGRTGPVTDIQSDFLETVKQQTDHLQRMIDDLLEFSRLESGRVALRLQPTDIPVVIEAVVDKLTPLAETAEVILINQTPDDMPTISADPWRLEQVVTNLVDNAIKFTPIRGTVTIVAADRADEIEVRVQDTGIGIPAAEVERVFDRFYQVDGGANRLYKGTGLGLTICRHIVEHHGGRIWAESAPGEGAVFAFTISKHLQPAEVGRLDFTTLPQEQ